MTPEFSTREEQLLVAALHPDGATAAASWEKWASELPLEEVPYPELRLLTAVYAHLSRVAPSLKLPSKLRGKARATFAANNLLSHACLPIIDELSRYSPVLVTKGFAICVRFGAWASRAMGDLDLHVPLGSLEVVCRILAESGWTPKYGMTWASLVHRSSLRRNSWNVTKGEADLDLHWRIYEGPAEKWLERAMWSTSERVEYLGRTVTLQSPEFALITTLQHGFKDGTHGDALQTVIDASLLLPRCRLDRLRPLLQRTDLVWRFALLLPILEKSGLPELAASFSLARQGILGDVRAKVDRFGRFRRRRLSLWRPPTEISVLRRPRLYRSWEAFGRKAWIERILLRWAGPMSKPLTDGEVFSDDYDLRDCAAMDQIGGPGWGWPEPEHTRFWSDRPDARLLIPLSQVADHIIVVGLGQRRSSNPSVNVFANGVLVTALNINARVTISDYCLVVPKSVLFGPWIELSFRPAPYAGTRTPTAYHLKRSVPARRLRIFDAQKMSEIFSSSHKPQLYFTMLDAEEPQASKFARIKERIANSPHRNASGLPADFDAFVYILSYPDLFEHEVDPYEHYLHHGSHEGRWEQ